MKAVVVFANGKMNYLAGADRIKKSLLHQNFDGNFFLFKTNPSFCPPHQKSSYAFKPFCIKEVWNKGFTEILYLDSSTKILGNINKIFDLIETEGHFLHVSKQDTDGTIGRYCKDEVLKLFKKTRDEVMEIQCHVGSFYGLNMKKEVNQYFLNEFIDRANDGSFYLAGGNYDNYWQKNRTDVRQMGHRQQAVTSLIAHELKMKTTQDFASVRPFDNEQFKESHILPNTILWSDRKFVKQNYLMIL